MLLTYVRTFHFFEYSLLPRLNDLPKESPPKEIIFITGKTEREAISLPLSSPRNKTKLNLLPEEKYYPGISSN